MTLKLETTTYQERLEAALTAIPQSDRSPDGMPTEEAIRATAEKLLQTCSPDELRDAAVRGIEDMAETYFELLVKMGAAERVGNGQYRKLRDTTAQEETEIEAAMEREEQSLRTY
jgi:ferritin-like metal-binding protein YciE